MKLIQTKCPICGKNDADEVVYKANFSLKDLNVKVFSARRLPDKLHYCLVQCKHDGLVRSNPIASSDQLFVLYKKSKFTYHDELNNLIQTYMTALEPALEHIEKNDSILEIGCGNGFLLQSLRKKGYTNLHGVEPSVEAIKKAPAEVRSKIKQNVFRAKLFKHESMKLVFLFQTLDHIPNPDIFLKEVYDVLQPGGYLFCFQHDIGSYSSSLLKEKSPIIDIEHTCLYDKETLRKISVRCGFTPLHIKSEWNIVSLRHLLWLFPFPKKIKQLFVLQDTAISRILQRISIPLKLGNTSLLAQKP